MTDGLAMQESLPPNWAGIVLSMTVFGVIFLFIVKQMLKRNRFAERRLSLARCFFCLSRV